MNPELKEVAGGIIRYESYDGGLPEHEFRLTSGVIGLDNFKREMTTLISDTIQIDLCEEIRGDNFGLYLEVSGKTFTVKGHKKKHLNQLFDDALKGLHAQPLAK